MTHELRPTTRWRRVGCLLCGLAAMFFSVAYAGINEWTYVGLAPEEIMDIEVHPSNPNVIYAGAADVWWDETREGGLFRTTDHGLEWDTVAFRHHTITDIQIDPQRPETVWVALDVEGTWRSVNGGLTWENRSTGLYLGGPDNFRAWNLAMSPWNPNLMMCAGVSDIAWGWLYRTTNGGELWQRVEFDWWNQPIGKVLFDPLEPGRVYAWDTWLETIWASNDTGISFQQVTTFGNPDYVRDFDSDTFEQDGLWIIGDDVVGHTTDACSTWTLYYPDSLAGTSVGWRIHVSTLHSDRIVITDNRRGVHYTSDGANNWSPLDRGFPGNNVGLTAISVVNWLLPELMIGVAQFGLFSYEFQDSLGGIGNSGEKGRRPQPTVHPNPASEFITITLPSNRPTTSLTLYNLLGQTIVSAIDLYPGRTVRLDLPAFLPSGAYICVFQADNSNYAPESVYITISK